MVVTAALAVGISTAMADGIGSLPTVSVGNHEVHYYEVKRGDNLYSIAERLPPLYRIEQPFGCGRRETADASLLPETG